MHIILTTSEFMTENIYGGGLANYIANVSMILANHKHKVTIIVLSKRIKTVEWKPNIRVVRVQKGHGKLWHTLLENSIHTERRILAGMLADSYAINQKIMEIHKETPVDIVQFWGDHGAGYYRNQKIPSVTRISSYQPLFRLAYQPHFELEFEQEKLLLQEKFSLYTLRRTDAVYGPSRANADIISRKIKKKISVIESPFNIENIKFDEKIYEEKIGDKKYLLFYGTLGYLKGVHIIASIIYQFLDKFPDYYFVLVGKDLGLQEENGYISAATLIEKKAAEYSERIIYLSEIKKREQLFSIISHAFACVLPSRIDNLPNTCIESMALGKIVIGTNGASFEQLIENKKSGLLVERESPESLMNAIEYLMNMTDRERLEMEKLARERTRLLKPEVIYRQLIDFYEEIISKKKGKELKL